jgi:hypothetical protein
MEGGEISDNGVANQPGSGILMLAYLGTKLILNGPVTITNNSIGFIAYKSDGYEMGSVPAIGSYFNSSGVIAVDLIVYTGLEDFTTQWLGSQFLTSIEDDPVTITKDIAKKFAVTNYYAMTNTDPPVRKEDISYGIDDSGVIVDLAGE